MAFHSLFAPKDPLDKALYDYIHSILGFYPKNISLYRVAFTHKSMAEETVGHYRVSNERMEYLGDAVLSVAVADFLFHTYPTQPEGFLTEMRSRIVSRSSLNKLSQKLGFENYIRHAPNTGNGMGFKSVGGNAFEALMGAIYLDRGFEFAKKVIIERIIRVHIDVDELQHTEINFKSKLLEWAQRHTPMPKTVPFAEPSNKQQKKPSKPLRHKSRVAQNTDKSFNASRVSPSGKDSNNFSVSC